uniref:DUF5050 domain-containing protein n=1 Tax=Branchiostoma floridae TaxID=7739 RepID=C3YB12_BRAFL|eukprot:XP_002606464.1 hypothetical protein BRAFLDRAFT_93255 [Branchiostoma floridae]
MLLAKALVIRHPTLGDRCLFLAICCDYTFPWFRGHDDVIGLDSYTLREGCLHSAVPMYEKAEPVRSPFPRPDSGQTSGPPPQTPPVHQDGSRGPVRHGNGASDKSQEEQETSSHIYEEAEEVKRNATYTSTDRTYPGEASGRRALSSFIRSHRSCMVAGIAVLLSLFAVCFAPLTFINKEEITQLTTTVDALKRDQDDIRQLTTTVEALKRDQDDIRQLTTTVEALKRVQDDIRQLTTTVDALTHDQDDKRRLTATVEALKRHQDDIRQLTTTVEALKRHQDDIRQLTTTVEALKRDQDNIRQLSTTVDVLKRDQDDMRQLSTTTDALKRDLDKERSRTGPILEQRLDETSKTPGDHDSRKNSEPFLLVADRLEETIIQVDITSGSKVTLPLVGVGQPLALDFDPLTDYVYWSDYWNGNIKRARRDGSGMETIIDTDDSLVYGLALDHAGGNIYWSVNRPATISVAKKDGSSARTLLSSPAIGNPEQLVLDPRNGLVYWVDCSKGSIDSAAMDGSNQTTIITGLNNPRAITIDFTEDRLYYSNQRDRIYSSDLLGNDIRVLYERGKDVKGIAVDEDFVYWSSAWRDSSSSSSSQGKIGKLSKSDLTKTVLVDGIDYPWGIYLSTAAPPGVTTGKAATQSGQGKDTIQPNSDTYMCHALAMNTLSEDTKTKAPIQKNIVASTSKEDFPVPLAGRDSPENSADAPALSGGVGTMRESPHPPNQASVHMNPLSNFTHEHSPRPSDPELARDASNPVYGHDLKGTDPDTDLRPAGMQPYAVGNQEEDADDDKDHQPANMEPYAVKYQEEDDDDDKDHQPAGMEPYAVKYQEEDDDDDDKDHQPAGMEPYAVKYQEEDDDDDDKDHQPANMEPYAVKYQEEDDDDDKDHQPAGMEPYAVRYQEEDADDEDPREAAGGTTPMQQTDWQARADAVASIPNPMYASRAGTTPNQQTDWQARADAVASIPNPMYASRADRQYPGGPSGCRALCSFIRSRLTYIATGIALLLILVAVGLALLALINNEEISEQTTTVDVQTTTVDALKCDQDNMSTSVDALKRDQDNMPTTLCPDDLSRSSTVYGLALDHAGGNIYWSVNRPATISVAKKDGSSARTLLTSPAIGYPEQLVLDPRNELMYWVEPNKDSICRAAMDGSGQTTIITGLNGPRAITIDFTEDRLYYSNQKYGIYSSDLLGNDIRQVLFEDGNYVHGIAVDGDFVYWSSHWLDSSSSTSARGKIGKLSKSDLTKTVLVDGIDYPWGIYLSTAAPPGVTTAPPGVTTDTEKVNEGSECVKRP